MASEASKSVIINVTIEEGRAGLFYAQSASLPGLLVAEPDMNALYAALPDAIEEVFAAQGIKMIAFPAHTSSPAHHIWVAVPQTEAERAVQRIFKSA